MSTSPRILAVAVLMVLWGLILHGASAGTRHEPHYETLAHSHRVRSTSRPHKQLWHPHHLALGNSLKADAMPVREKMAATGRSKMGHAASFRAVLCSRS
jgi:hypothetical protein